MPQAELPDLLRLREVFQDVLAQPEFAGTGASPLAAALRAVADAVEALLARWFPDVELGVIQVLGLAVGLAAVAAGVYALARRSKLGGRARRPPAQRLAEPVARTPAAWAAWAREQSAAGRLREAATGVYQAVVLHLESRGALRYGEWKTPGDYALEVEAQEGLSAPFRRFLAAFVTVAFGEREPTSESVATLFTHAERLGCPT